MSIVRTYDLRSPGQVSPPLQPLQSRMASESRFQTSPVPVVQEHQVGCSISSQAYLPHVRERMGRKREAPEEMSLMQERDLEQEPYSRSMQGLRASVDSQGRQGS